MIGGIIFVSIPFKRESVSKASAVDRVNRLCTGFNSLQTGKCIQSRCVKRILRVSPGFNSLQTGKCIQSLFEKGICEIGQCFNSLQTGKCIQSLCNACPTTGYSVSIPFKRESVSKEVNYQGFLRNDQVSIPFKRESVSKAVAPDISEEVLSEVSIPFKRESVSKVYIKSEGGE